MTKKLITLFFVSLFILCHSVKAQIHYSLFLDKTYSALSGAENLLTLHKSIQLVENRYLKTRLFEENNFSRKALGILYRLSKTLVVDQPIGMLGIHVQHEIFGHGARFREFNFSGIKYHIELSFPFGKGNSYVSVDSLQNRKITKHETLTMLLSGPQANTLLSNSIRTKWLLRKKMNYWEAFYYLINHNTLTLGIIATNDDSAPQTNDVARYLKMMNYEGEQPWQHLYEQFPVDDSMFKLNINDLKRQVLINLLNPFQYYSLYCFFKTYLWAGEEKISIPMIRLGGVDYLPAFRLGLTPFGSEFYFENFIAASQRLINFYVRYGEPTFHRFWGTGFYINNLITSDAFSMDMGAHLWHQPQLLLGGSEIIEGSQGLGGALSFTLYGKIFKQLNIMGTIGYKTSGFLEGETLQKGLTLRIGLSFLDSSFLK